MKKFLILADYYYHKGIHYKVGDILFEADDYDYVAKTNRPSMKFIGKADAKIEASDGNVDMAIRSELNEALAKLGIPADAAEGMYKDANAKTGEEKLALLQRLLDEEEEKAPEPKKGRK
jgi:hypothetical protein